MIKQVKRTSGAKILKRQGLKHNIQDLFARIYVGERTTCENIEIQGLLIKIATADRCAQV
jgi:hypothetical protein